MNERYRLSIELRPLPQAAMEEILNRVHDIVKFEHEIYLTVDKAVLKERE